MKRGNWYLQYSYDHHECRPYPSKVRFFTTKTERVLLADATSAKKAREIAQQNWAQILKHEESIQAEQRKDPTVLRVERRLPRDPHIVHEIPL